MWVASPLSYDSFIHYNLAGLTGAQELIDGKEELDQHAEGHQEGKRHHCACEE